MWCITFSRGNKENQLSTEETEEGGYVGRPLTIHIILFFCLYSETELILVIEGVFYDRISSYVGGMPLTCVMNGEGRIRRQ